MLISIIRFFKSLPEYLQWMFVAVLVMAIHYPLITKYGSENNLYAHQAKAWIDGQLNFEAEYYWDAAIYEGKKYVPFPPFPSVLLLPATMVLGDQYSEFPVLFLTIILGIVNAFLMLRIFRKLEVPNDLQLWLLAAGLLGTGYWYLTYISHHANGLAHTLSFTMLTIAIHEMLHKGRGLLIGLCIGASFLSRQLTIFTFFFFLMFLWQKHEIQSIRIRQVILLIISLGACVLAYLAFNYARFGNPLDTGYAYLPYSGFIKDRVAQYGLFNFHYLPFNAYHMFFQGFDIQFGGPLHMKAEGMNPFGTSLLVASPFALFAFWGRWNKPVIIACWFSLTIMMVQMLMYFNNGWEQLNAQRFSQDLMPLLLFLMALSLRRLQHSRMLFKGLVCYAIILNLIAFVIHFSTQV